MEPSRSLRPETITGAMTRAQFITGTKKSVIYNKFMEFYVSAIKIALKIIL
jgi:hypothetical protein